MPQAGIGSPLVGSLLMLCLACADGTAPVPQSPAPPPPQTTPPSTAMSGFIWGQVLDESGVCLRGGTVEIVEGPGTGRTSGQPESCGAWDYVGYGLDNLPLGASVTLRASAPGYRSEDRVVVAHNGGLPVQFVLAPQ